MAPAKRNAEVAAAAAEAPAPVRVTRAAAKRAAAAAAPPPVEKKQAKKKAKVAAKPKKKEEKENEKENDDVSEAEAEKVEEEKEEGGEAAENVLDASNKTIVVEHCKQCKSFKTRADQVKEGLEKADIGLSVILNPEKPRKGCFEIRQQGGGKKFTSLLNMKRPFKRMKDLDMGKVISDIIDELAKAS